MNKEAKFNVKPNNTTLHKGQKHSEIMQVVGLDDKNIFSIFILLQDLNGLWISYRKAVFY